MSKGAMQEEMRTDPNYIAMAVQEFLLSLTKAGAIHWGKYDQGATLEDLDKQLKGEVVEDRERPCYSIDLRFILGYMEDTEFKAPQSPNELAECEVTGYSLQLYIDQLDDEGESEQTVLNIDIPLGVAAEAERSHREYEELLSAHKDAIERGNR